MKIFSTKKLLIFLVFLFSISIISAYLFYFLYRGEWPYYEHIDLNKIGDRINSQVAYRFFLNGKAIFIDARSEDEFQVAHISGAVNLPFRSPREFKLSVLSQYSMTDVFIVYCDNPDCPLAEKLAGQLKYLGYIKVYLYDEGLDAWQLQGYTMEGQK